MVDVKFSLLEFKIHFSIERKKDYILERKYIIF